MALRRLSHVLRVVRLDGHLSPFALAILARRSLCPPRPRCVVRPALASFSPRALVSFASPFRSSCPSLFSLSPVRRSFSSWPFFPRLASLPLSFFFFLSSPFSCVPIRLVQRRCPCKSFASVSQPPLFVFRSSFSLPFALLSLPLLFSLSFLVVVFFLPLSHQFQ